MSEFPVDGQETPKPSVSFRRVADQIDLNEKGSFGGAFVIVPPANGGSALEVILLDTSQNPTQFWGIIKAKAEIALSELDRIEREGMSFGRR